MCTMEGPHETNYHGGVDMEQVSQYGVSGGNVLKELEPALGRGTPTILKRWSH